LTHKNKNQKIKTTLSRGLSLEDRDEISGLDFQPLSAQVLQHLAGFEPPGAAPNLSLKKAHFATGFS